MALAEAVHGMLTPGPSAGPRSPSVRHDQAMYYTTSILYNSGLDWLDIHPYPVMGYSGHLKGKIERFFRTLRTECLDLMPGSRRVAQLLGQEKEADPNDRL